MSTFERVKKVLVEQLDVSEDEVTPQPPLWMIWARTRWMSSRSSWDWKRNSTSKSPTRTPKKSRPSSRSSAYVEEKGKG